jgi:hypothetical protein
MGIQTVWYALVIWHWTYEHFRVWKKINLCLWIDNICTLITLRNGP